MCHLADRVLPVELLLSDHEKDEGRLLQHAFERLNCIAVEFRTHFFDQQSRAAIARLGAKQDGILRNHSVAPNGTLRDTVVFSIINSEWPTVKAHLAYQLTKARA